MSSHHISFKTKLNNALSLMTLLLLLGSIFLTLTHALQQQGTQSEAKIVPVNVIVSPTKPIPDNVTPTIFGYPVSY